MKLSELKNMKKAGNKKIRNATKCELDGFKFDSRLEMYCYSRLKQLKINFQLKRKFVLQGKFRYMGEAIREITWTPDFVIGIGIMKAVIDCKGFSNDVSPIKIKMFKKLIAHQVPIYLPSNKKEVDSCLLKILGP